MICLESDYLLACGSNVIPITTVVVLLVLCYQ